MEHIERPFLTAEWRDLVIFNYQVDPKLLDKWLPLGTELDDWKGTHFVSLVAFKFKNTKVLGLKIPFHVNFEEVNLRFYVRRKVDSEIRRGVVFIKEIVPRFMIASVARLLYHEPYVRMPMRHFTQSTSRNYEWKSRTGWNAIKIDIAEESQEIAVGSKEEFITEHYWGYNGGGGRPTMEYPVAHPRWRVRKTKFPILACDIKNVYGPEWLQTLSAPPASVMFAEGSEIAVGKGKKI
jgi:uncharacterized protein